MTAEERIEALVEMAPRYAEVYDRNYKNKSKTRKDVLDFDLISGEIEDLLACDECGSGGIEDARFMRDNNPGECSECEDFAELWDLHADELDPYTWEI